MGDIWTTKRLALAGAIFGGAVGLLLLAGTDPSDSSTNDAYRSGQRFGYVLRYAALGAAAAVLGARFLRPSQGTPTGTVALYLAGFAVVLGIAILPPLLDEETASERRRADAVRTGSERAEFRAGAVDGCVQAVRSRFGAQVEQASFNVDGYCECVIDKLMAGAVERGVSLEALATQVQAGTEPPWARSAGETCGRGAVGP
jgi:hypothetical protein